MGILSRKTSKKKEEVKIAQAYNCDECIVYTCYVNCPHCAYGQSVESYQHKSGTHICKSCRKQFNIEWE